MLTKSMIFAALCLTALPGAAMAAPYHDSMWNQGGGYNPTNVTKFYKNGSSTFGPQRTMKIHHVAVRHVVKPRHLMG